ncbi:LCP family protein [Nakamurella endophytica]|nr:LCP family protein [Nakamurella endophytica]
MPGGRTPGGVPAGTGPTVRAGGPPAGRPDRARQAWSEWAEQGGQGTRPPAAGRRADAGPPTAILPPDVGGAPGRPDRRPQDARTAAAGYARGPQDPRAAGYGRPAGGPPPHTAPRAAGSPRPAAGVVAARTGRPPRRRAGAGIVAGRVVAAVLSVAVLVGCGVFWGFANNATASVADSNGVQDAGSAGVTLAGGVNILLVGSDSRTDQDGNPLTPAELAEVRTTLDDGGTNTDTIMVVHIPEGGGKATAVSLPRDTWIPQSVTDRVKGPYDDGTSGTYKPNKINSFYSTAKFYTEQALARKGVGESPARERQSDEAGRTMLIRIVQAFTGLKIDHYAEVNLIGFYQLSLAIGGVPVCLNKAVDDPFSGAKFAAGPQEVSGSSAMAFVRQRHGLPNGDLDRVRRQQAFLAGATRKMLSADVLGSPSKLSALLDASSKSLTLDKGFNLIDFAGQMAGLSSGNVTFTTIPTHGAESSTSTDALATDPAEIKRFFAAISGGPERTSGSAATGSSAAAGTTTRTSATAVDPASVTVDVQDATAAATAGTPVMDRLASAGFVRGQNVDAPGIDSDTEHATTTIGYGKGGQTAAEAVRAALGGVGTVTQEGSVAAGHVSVVVGTDLAGQGLRAGGAALRPAAAPSAPGTGTGTAPAPTSGDAITAGTVGCVN